MTSSWFFLSILNYCLCQLLHWNRSDWNVISQQRATVWRQQNGFVSSRQSGQIRAAVCIRFECCCSGLTATYCSTYKSGQTCRIKCSYTCLAMYDQTNDGLLCCVGSGTNVARHNVACVSHHMTLCNHIYSSWSLSAEKGSCDSVSYLRFLSPICKCRNL